MMSSFYYRIRNNYKFNILVWLLRFLLAFGFIPSGMKKVLGERFTNIGTEYQVGYFFEALYRTGIYWNFIGWGQILAAGLMMTQRFSTLGNIIYFFIISNIFIITISMHFTGTWIIALLMLFASFCLLLWDANKLQYVFNVKGLLIQYKFGDLPEAKPIWQICGWILFILSITYTLYDRIITNFHGSQLLIFFLCVVVTILTTLIIEIKSLNEK